ncbi:MAG: hypothetical protein CL916_14775 [Deltaproteobacteria bacterium]|nr:hypothetical protein [Deltaproteobacteria bacterium]
MIFSLIFLAMAEIPTGSTIQKAASIDIPPDGFTAVSSLITEIIPEAIPVDDTQGEGEGLGCDYTYGISDVLVSLDVDQATITPQNGYLTLDIVILLSLNSATDRFGLDFVVDSCGWFDSASQCNGYVTPLPVNAQARLDLTLIDPDGDGIQELDATISNLVLDYTVDAENFELECVVGSILDALNWIGVDVYSFVFDLVAPTLQEELEQELPELEETIEEAFANATINQELEIDQTVMTLQLSPEEINILPEGLRVSFDGMTNVAETAECILSLDTGNSVSTPGEPNPIGELQEQADLGIAIQDEFVNQALYSLWRGGVLCQTIDEDTFALDTSILNLLTGNSFTEIFEETKPMILEVIPLSPPTVNMQESDHVGVSIKDLQLDFITEIDHRRVRVLSISLEALAELLLNFDANTGLLEGQLQIDPSYVVATIGSNEFRPNESQQITDSFVEQFPSILDLVGLEEILGDLTFTLPSVEGIGVNQLLTASTGSAQTDLGLYSSIGPVPYTGGCSEDGEAGCSTTRLPSGKGLLLFMVAILGYLRRRAR